MSQYLLKRKYIATVNQKSGSKRMPAEMSVKPVHPGSLSQSGEHQL